MPFARRVRGNHSRARVTASLRETEFCFQSMSSYVKDQEGTQLSTLRVHVLPRECYTYSGVCQKFYDTNLGESMGLSPIGVYVSCGVEVYMHWRSAASCPGVPGHDRVCETIGSHWYGGSEFEVGCEH